MYSSFSLGDGDTKIGKVASTFLHGDIGNDNEAM
jgi:hypothetical protein